MNEATLGPGTSVRYGGRRATVGALAVHRDRLCALTVAHLFSRRARRPIVFGRGSGTAVLLRRVRLRARRQHPGDVALLSVASAGVIVPPHPVVGPLRGHLKGVPVGLEVALATAAGVYRGRVVDPSWTARVRYPWGRRWLTDQVLVEVSAGGPVRGGDSGGLWVTEDAEAVGLQVAWIEGIAVVSPLAALLEGWQARLLRGERPIVLSHASRAEQARKAIAIAV